MNGNEFDCLLCKNKHEMPKNGLPNNEALLEMLSVKPTSVSRGTAYDLLENSLNKIQKKKSQFKLGIDNSSDFINEHCIELRSDVQLRTEEVILQVNDFSSKIIEEIDDYEKELIEFNKTNNSVSLDEFNQMVIELESFYNLKADYLKQYKVNDELLIKSNEEATDLIKKAELELEKLKDVIFDRKILSFEKSSNKINNSILGVIIDNRFDSFILFGIDQKKDLIELCDIQATKRFNLIYRASQDGFEASSFHAKCDKQPNTLIIIKSEHGNIFGGYTEQDWTPNEGLKTDSNSYIFSLINKDNKPLKLKCPDALEAIWCASAYGPIFGYGAAIRICNNSNQNKVSDSFLGDNNCVYKHPLYSDNSLNAKFFLAGSHSFKVLEIEAYILR
jgi:hypothetical protein